MIDFKTSIFHDFVKHQGIFPLQDIILSVKDDKLKAITEKIQLLILQGKIKEAKVLKKKLPGFTPYGIFPNGRRADLLQIYNPVICLDFDKVKEALPELRKTVDALPTTYASFISPSGNGLKVFVITTATKHQHFQSFSQVANEYEKQTGIKSDRSVKDIPRLCFLSYDPNVYLNSSCEIFQINEVPVQQSRDTSNQLNYQGAFANCMSITEKNGMYINGNRNNFIFRLAKCCKLSGIPFEECLMLCSVNYDLEYKELVSTVRSAFTHNNIGFAGFANSAPSYISDTNDDSFLKTSPTIPIDDYNLMPELLKTGALSFSNPRERDVFFTGALSILSGCLPNVQGVYNQQIVYPNLFSFVIAPPASGKGVLKYSRALGSKIQESYIHNNQSMEKEYQDELLAYNHRSRKKNAKLEKPPTPPIHKVFFIPANSSYAKILNHLKDNGGHGVICETEADTMNNVLKKEWGSYSDLLRKSFHHEAITSSRKTNNEFLEIPFPRLSMALTGTPGQIAGLISSAEDGLFSRFLFYVYKSKPIWHDVSPKIGQMSLTEKFCYLSQDIYDHYQYLNNIRLKFSLTDKQWVTLNDSFSCMLCDVTSFTSDNAASIVLRLGLLLFRMAMIFTTLRLKEQDISEQEVQCQDDDFQLALRLSRIYLQHSLIMYNSLPKKSSKIVFSEAPNKEAFFNALPNTFARAEAISLGPKYSMSTRTIDGLLKKLLDIKLQKTGTGMYRKA
jgi:hypothetical protein